MKTIISLCSGILLLFACGFYYLSGRDAAMNRTEVRIFMDVTDKDSNRITGNEILQAALGNNTSQAIRVQIEPLSDFHNNIRQVVSIPKESILLGNATKRKRALERFTRDIDSVLHILHSGQTNKQQSAIFEQIVSASNALSSISAKRRIIVVSSDLCDNTQVWSVYRKADRDLLTTHPGKVKELLLQGAVLKDLHDITIYLIHEPRSALDDARYTMMGKFYATVFESHGATVHVGSNLTH